MLMDSHKSDIKRFIALPNLESQSLERNLSNILHAIRVHLGLDVGFISQFLDGRRVFRYVDEAGAEQLLKVGGSDPLDASFCQRVVNGRLPEVLPNAMLNPEAAKLANAAGLNIGAHISVPIHLKSGKIYGTFCCFSSNPKESLNERDLAMMRIFADLAADQIDQDIENRKDIYESRKRVEAVLASDALRMVYQPIVSIKDNMIVGFESLSRFHAEPKRTPDLWFKEAASVGLGGELEAKAILQGLSGLSLMPQDIYVSVNISPSTLLASDPNILFEGFPSNRIVVEITEHAIVDDYEDLCAIINVLRERGFRIAVDDAGAGYASFRHILALS